MSYRLQVVVADHLAAKIAELARRERRSVSSWCEVRLNKIVREEWKDRDAQEKAGRLGGGL